MIFDPIEPIVPGSRSAGGEASHTAREARNEVEELRFSVERLLMITEGLWRILKEKHGYDDNELVKQIALIDLEDGKLDGRVSTKAEPKPCPKCNRIIAKHRPRCLYCGEPIPPAPFAR